VSVLAAINRIYEHDGHSYHVQTEDLGTEEGCFEVRVFEKGTVLWHKRVPYAEVLGRNLPKAETEEQIHSLMEKTLHTVEAAIAKGKLG
jgi:hypothetical protein